MENMTAEIPQEHHQPDPLEALRASAIDPALADVLDNANEVQDGLRRRPELNRKIVNDALKPVNDLWASTDYPGTIGRFTGKVRECFEGASDNPSISRLLKDLPHGEDERGEYWMVNDLELVCAYFTVATGEENALDETGRVGLSMIAPDDYDEDIDIDEGELLMYADEIERASFARPTAVTIERQLAYHFPDLHKKLMQELPDATNLSPRAIVRFIQEFYVPADESLYHDYPITDRLGAYIFNRLEFDDELYEVSVKGPLYSIDENEKEVDTLASKYHHYSLRGIICGIQMMHDDESFDEAVYRPHLLLAVPEPTKGGGYYACIVPPETLVNLRSQRSAHTQFGKIALLSFEHASDITEYFAEPMMSDDMAAEAAPENEIDPVKLHIDFTALTRGLDQELPQLLSYDQRHGRHVISVRRDMSRVANDFADHVVAHGEAHPDTPLTQQDYASIEKKMLRTYERMQEIMVGDTLATMGEVLALGEDEHGSAQAIALHAEFSLQGRFMGFRLASHPELTLRADANFAEAVEVNEVSICAIVTDGKVVNSDGDDQGWDSMPSELLLPITLNNTDRFVKLEANQE